MNFTLSEEQRMIQQATREFAQKELLPGVIKRDENQTFPKEQVQKMAEMGLMGMMCSPKYGGGGIEGPTENVSVEVLLHMSVTVNEYSINSS